MRTIKFTLLICLILLSIDSYSQGWVAQNSGVTTSLKKVVFVNSNTGFICGAGGKILKTTNAGTNWNALTSGTTNDLYSITYADSVNLWACGGSGTILRTTNGGTSWNLLTSGTTVTLRFISYNGVYGSSFAVNTCGENGVVLATINAGANWFPLNNPSTQTLNTLHFPNAVTGFAFGNSGTVLYTTGSTFAVWTFPSTENILDCKGVLFSITLAMSGGKVAKSLNNGNNWNVISTGTTNVLNGIALKGKKVWTAGGSGTIRYSNDSGYTWQGQISNTTTNLNSVFMTDTLHGWVVGENGIVLTTGTGGTIGVTNISTEIPSSFSLSQNYPNPFNPSTKIKFSVSKESDVLISLYDATGKEIYKLVNERLQPGTYETPFDGSGITSGVYFYRMKTNGFTETKRMLLIK